MSAANSILVRQKYRSLARLVKLLPETKFPHEKTWQELRTSFRRPLASDESLQDRISEADSRLSFLRMITPKTRRVEGEGGTWTYRNGERVEGASHVKRDQNGRVISNWDGKNLDPDSVKRHNHHLKRLGFRNNAHAKGIF